VIKIIIGIAIGCMLYAYYPTIGTVAKVKFLESGGARDTLVNVIKEIK
jgi:hypothetical protein